MKRKRWRNSRRWSHHEICWFAIVAWNRITQLHCAASVLNSKISFLLVFCLLRASHFSLLVWSSLTNPSRVCVYEERKTRRRRRNLFSFMKSENISLRSAFTSNKHTKCFFGWITSLASFFCFIRYRHGYFFFFQLAVSFIIFRMNLRMQVSLASLSCNEFRVAKLLVGLFLVIRNDKKSEPIDDEVRHELMNGRPT